MWFVDYSCIKLSFCTGMDPYFSLNKDYSANTGTRQGKGLNTSTVEEEMVHFFMV